MLSAIYVRFEATVANSRGVTPGIFALANELAHSNKLSDEDFVWWRENNDWFNAAYANPGAIDSTLFDRSVHPRTVCWFKTSANHLLTRATGYLNLLDRYGVGWVERRSKDPGLILYEDDVQVVVAT
ncbi:hypothetical protein SAMN05216368_12031 [Cryobacterium flavum]|uniref:Uncharacterized protein n=1 Tax=Cryobacterium flavum TaxID=1424659 RepID=A0A4R8VFM6_9MICO|nr:hypothetical protein [Cryobacterium flavum]TFB82394.1 hypothetical protein E3O21_00160 [Cryobacterium flavum]SDO50464.1 hypothetical protein SAMN05216368_12031 [Cryobacterium flavum]